MKCKIPTCEITEETQLDLHHIVPRFMFPKEYKQGKKWDLITLDGIEWSNRIYLCKQHHKIFTHIDMIIYHSTKNLNQQEKNKLHKTIYNHTFQLLKLLK